MSKRRISDHDRPETYAAYTAVAKVGGSEDSLAVVVGWKPTGLSVHFPNGEVLHYDLKGRLMRIAHPGCQWRRGLSGRWLQLKRSARAERGSLQRTHIEASEADRLLTDTHRRMRDVHAAFQADDINHEQSRRESDETWHQLELTLALSAAFDVAAAQEDLWSFQSLYHDIPILPPDQYTSLVLLASDGCRYNKCTFCNFYRDVQYRARPLNLFAEHVERAVAYHGASLASRRHIFLGQANALLGPPAWRDEILQFVNQRFELPTADTPRADISWWQGSASRYAGITSFLDAFAGARIEAAEFAAMRSLNLRHIYIGMESGSARLLEWLRKPSDTDQMVDTVKAAKQGGVSAGVIVLIGAGGERYFDTHVEETIRVFKEMQLGRGDFIYLSPLVSAHGAEYDQLAAAESIQPLTPTRLAEQEQMIRSGIGAGPSRDGPYVAHYEVEHFVY